MKEHFLSLTDFAAETHLLARKESWLVRKFYSSNSLLFKAERHLLHWTGTRKSINTTHFYRLLMSNAASVGLSGYYLMYTRISQISRRTVTDTSRHIHTDLFGIVVCSQ